MGNGTEIGRVRGLGAAHRGTEHWIAQRMTAFGNLILFSWLAVSIVLMGGLSRTAVAEWLAAPIPATLLILLIGNVFYHARLGLQVLIEDYVHDEGNKAGALAALNLVAVAGAVFGIVCVLKVSLGGAA